ncbi:MAG TPA: tetratricopeptide repeat protein [Desulfomonilaceae bacterium]|nr:tetratricopeptide repeat protein [Desulfomonilaceae bacterium]
MFTREPGLTGHSCLDRGVIDMSATSRSATLACANPLLLSEPGLLALPYTRTTTGRSVRSYVIRAILICLCALLTTGGCARKAARHGAPFDLNRVFSGKSSPLKESWKEQGIRQAKEGDFEQAVEAFTQHVVQEPETFFGFNAIAICYKNMGDHTKAMQNFERALEFADEKEEKAKVLANIGNLYFAADKPQVALGYYKEAAAEFEKNPLYLILIARTWVMLDENDRARKVLVAAEDLHKNLEKYERGDEKGLGDYLMAQCYLALTDEEKVYQRLESALKANPFRYVKRIEKDLADEKSLLYTLKDDERLKKILKVYAAKASPATWVSIE